MAKADESLNADQLAGVLTRTSDGGGELSDALGDAYDAIVARDDAVARIEDNADAAGETPAKNGKDKDSAAETAPGGETAEATEAATKDADQTESGEGEAEAETAEAATATTAPADWPDAERTAFAKLPAEAQETLLKLDGARKEAFQARSQEIEASIGDAKQLSAAVEPYRDYCKGLQTTPEHLVRVLMGAEQRLRTGTAEQKREMLVALAKDYGVDLLPKTETETGDLTDDALAAPEVVALRKHVKDLEGQVQRLSSDSQQIRQAEVARRQAELGAQTQAYERMVTDFAAEKNADGSLKHPHFEAVAVKAGNLLVKGIVKDLEDAYQTAVAADPVLRAQMTEAERQKLAKDIEAKQRAKSAQAKAKVNLPTADEPGAAKDAPKSIRESLEKAFDAAASA